MNWLVIITSGLAALAAILAWLYYAPRNSAVALPDWSNDWQSNKVFTSNELSQFDGRNGRPTYIVILGEVYDVTGSEHYGEDAGYYVFVAKDSTAAFVTGKFAKDAVARDDVSAFNHEQMRSIENWVDFYRKHETYKFVGVLEGRYYTRHGTRTGAWQKAREKMLPPPQVEEKAPEFSACNMRWDSNQKSTCWCDVKTEVPRLLNNKRCFCLPLEVARERAEEYILPHAHCAEESWICEQKK